MKKLEGMVLRNKMEGIGVGSQKQEDFVIKSVFDDEYRILKHFLLCTGLWPGQKKSIRLVFYVANLTLNVELISRKVINFLYKNKQFFNFVFQTLKFLIHLQIEQVYDNRTNLGDATFHAIPMVKFSFSFLLFLTNFHKNSTVIMKHLLQLELQKKPLKTIFY